MPRRKPGVNLRRRFGGTTVSCRWHGWKFDVTSGELQLNPEVCVPRYACRVEGEELLVSTQPEGA